ncbi:T-complex protein 1 subunit gamma [Camellia lanceoleosa]|uniref:T-complex protein 1 subunit gamma n=1 Tax=Camellia lanceoleosa TaxID=1840588 RepID=A0ACC0IU71_9ERIC|nr:T-complex protein 1 subunit gamma [Camellia lanceoleosa]
MFILELTLRSWNHTEENKRRTLQKNDIAAAITRTDIFDFLVDIVPREDLKDEALASIPRGTVPVGGPTDAYPYYYMPAQHSPQGSSTTTITLRFLVTETLTIPGKSDLKSVVASSLNSFKTHYPPDFSFSMEQILSICQHCSLPTCPSILFLAVLHYIVQKEPPKTEEMPVVLIAFVMSVFWISVISMQLLNCLAALRALLKLPPALLGLTVLAWANSVGHLVADVAVAKAGQPALAMAGCFAGPMFNMLFGLGTALLCDSEIQLGDSSEPFQSSLSKSKSKSNFISAIQIEDNLNRESGSRVQHANIQASKAVADIVRTTLGPRSMLKMLLDAAGDVAHPAAKSMIELSRTQDEEVGDGTTSVIVLAGEMLHVAEAFIDKNYHPTVICRAYNKALEDAILVLDKIAMPIDVNDRSG